MLLVIDIGNTTTMIGCYEEAKLLGHYRIASKTSRELTPMTTVDDLGLKVYQLLQIHALSDRHIEGAAICSVVPDLTRIYSEMVRLYFRADPWTLRHDADLGMSIKVHEPSLVGADRLANAVAVRHHYGFPAVVVDLGTATTFDVVDGAGDYIGGAIAPGVQTSAAELFRTAAQLFPIQIEKPDRFIGKNTTAAMRAGIFFGAVGMIDYLVEGILRELGAPDAKVIATGGYAEWLLPHSAFIQKIDPDLTLEGIRLTYERNHPRQDKGRAKMA